MKIEKFAFLGLRFSLAFIFLWAFFDKTFGLGFSTLKTAAWVNGGSPTTGFLTNAVKGPLAEFFTGLTQITLGEVILVDWIFMLGLLGVGLSLLLNRFTKWGSISGVLMMVLMYLAVFPPTTNPLLDDHIVYIFAFLLIGFKSRDRA